MSFNPHSTNIAPESAYNTANNQLAGKLLLLNELVSNLQNRLTPVLEPRGDCKVAAEGGAQAMRAAPAPVVAMLENHAGTVDAINEQISGLLKHLCL